MGDFDEQEKTPVDPPDTLPGYDVGFKEGYKLARTRIVYQYQRMLMANGATALDALRWAQALREWLDLHGG